MPTGGRPTVRSRRLGATLRRYRQAAKLDQPQAADVLGVHPTRVSRIESGHVTARVIEIRALLSAYGVADPQVRNRLEDLAKRSKHRGWWLEHSAHLREDHIDHISLEDDATYIQEWGPALFPGLLQTSTYAESVFTSGPNYIDPERVPQLVKVRVARQAKIEEGGATYTAIIWEPVITHPLVSTGIHHEQLSHILEVGRRQNVTIQVLPQGAGTLAGAISVFSSFGFGTEPIVEAVTLDNLRGASVLEGQEDLAAYANAFDQLRSSALAPGQSEKLIRDNLRKIEETSS
ncbi:helix-turn-helix domain-containing protein [Streptomyces turgidiscabies]|uniref:Transcriptional regulator with XRE-family HTH domain n=1 Tax=Streptomyces turgidiscabies TaxID=85558 RepID=A0ABU0RNN4_9ACTN|nr:helix-turn-helix transcriptional regulator [Streptomyces turgidiscabies]MDQ0933590.1 transcriptional regulator with XRE-family HTH domain [Streptomyces turgidiscabies]